MDYRELLKKYMDLVGYHEGTDFVPWPDDEEHILEDKDHPWSKLTEEERKELRVIARKEK